MCTALALPLDDMPVAVMDRHHLWDRVYDRAGKPEVRFDWKHMPWGCRDRGGPLPYGGWVAASHLNAGHLANARPQPVVIPAALGHHKGTWFLIHEGVKGVALGTRTGPVVYMLTTKASNYYRNMTEQSPAMPVLVDQVI